MSASIRARLLDLARASQRDFHSLAMRYVVERTLVRLEASPSHNRFILKGAMLFVAWKLDETRSTMDLDLLGKGNPDPADLVQTFREICDVTTDDDGLNFDTEGMKAAPIRAEAVYDGVRVVIPVHLGVMPIRLQVDVGFGDAVVPRPQRSEFPTLLGARGPRIETYAPETVIAEKLNAMVLLGMANSRMKDYYDIWLLSRHFSFEASLLGSAISSTFAKRQTRLPNSPPLGLSTEFGNDQIKQRQWAGFIKRQIRHQVPLELGEVVMVIREFLQPFFPEQSPRTALSLRWTPETGWRDGPARF